MTSLLALSGLHAGEGDALLLPLLRLRTDLQVQRVVSDSSSGSVEH